MTTPKVCVICGQERYRMTNAMTCGNKECQRQHNRNKMREYQAAHRAKLKAAESQIGDCDCCGGTDKARRLYQPDNYPHMVCRRCHTVLIYLRLDPVYARKVSDFFMECRKRLDA
jgi:hypothetical protein